MYKNSGGRFFNILDDDVDEDGGDDVDDDDVRADADVVVVGDVCTDTGAIFFTGDDGDCGVFCLRNAMDDAEPTAVGGIAGADIDGPIAMTGGA